MRKKYFVLLLAAFAGVVLSGCALVSRVNDSYSKDLTSSSSLSIDDSSDYDDYYSDDSNYSDDDSYSSDSDYTVTGVKRVGSDDYGYIDIPKKWVKFNDVDGGDSIQYSDGTDYNIVTMNAYTKKKANIQEGEEFTAETIANRIYSRWYDNKDVEDYWGAKTQVAGNESFQINVEFKSGQHLTTWVFKKGDKVYMISVEGEEKVIQYFVYYVEDTWGLDKGDSKSDI